MASFDLEPMEIPPKVMTILPISFNHQLIKLALKPSMDNEVRFEATFKVNINSKEMAARWLEEFQSLSLTTWRVHWTYPENSEKILFKKGYRCHHNTRPATHKTKNASEKHTNCRASLWISIYHPTKAQRKDSAFTKFPCIIVLGHTHNHLLTSSESLAWRDPGPEVKEKFLKLFTSYTPSAALELHKRDLLLEHGDNYPQMVADRGVCPNKMWVYHLYYKTYKAGYCKMRDELEIIPKLLERVAAYNERWECQCAKVEANDDYIAVAICTPLMQRVHEEIPSAAELVCCDSSAHIHGLECHVFLLMTHSGVGGLPLGVLITSSDLEEVLNEALSLFKDILPYKAFYGRGSGGPAALVVGDSPMQKKSLHFAFPQSVTVLGVYSVLQDVWRLIWDPETEVRDEDRIPLFAIVKSLVNSNSVEQLEANFSAGATHPIVTRYDKFVACYENLFSKRQDWAPCLRSINMECSGEADSLGEIALTVLRDKVLLRTKASNVVQLFCFLSSELDSYFKRKILQVMAGRAESRTRQGFIGFGSGKKRQRYQVMDTDAYLVFRIKGDATEEAWMVDADTWNCSCPIGQSGGACDHQFAVSDQRQLDPRQVMPNQFALDESVLHYVATGQKFVSGASESSFGSSSENNVMEMQLEAVSEEIACNRESVLNDCQDDGHMTETLHRLERLHEWMKSKLCSDSEQFLPAVRCFLDRFESFTNTAEVVSSLANFGDLSRDNGPQSDNRKRKVDNEICMACRPTIEMPPVFDFDPLNNQTSWGQKQTCLSAIKHEHNYCI